MDTVQQSTQNGLENLNVAHYYKNVLKHAEKNFPVFLVIVESLNDYKDNVARYLEKTNHKVYVLANTDIIDYIYKSNIIFIHKDRLSDDDLDRLYQECDYFYYPGEDLKIILPPMLSGVTPIQHFTLLWAALEAGVPQNKHTRIDNFERAKELLDKSK